MAVAKANRLWLYAFCPRKSVEQRCQVHAHELEAGSERHSRRDLHPSVRALNDGFRDTGPRAIGVALKTLIGRRHLKLLLAASEEW